MMFVRKVAVLVCLTTSWLLCDEGCVVNAFAPAATSRSHGSSCLMRRVESGMNRKVEKVSGCALHASAVPSDGLALEEDDWKMISQISSASDDEVVLKNMIAGTFLPKLHPRLIMFLRQNVNAEHVPENRWGVTPFQVKRVGRALTLVLEASLAGGRQVLQELLASGEIRKLDAAIGTAARAGKLDMAFFTVLNENIQDASMAMSQQSVEGGASRMQILQHIYTRCQEEVEKSVAPGIGLLNKLLRTEVESIRKNQMQHYLAPQPATSKIITPDGKEVELKNSSSEPLVSLQDFVDAMANSVKQIRTVERAGGTDKKSAADLVESIRQLAIEARYTLATVYGPDSPELQLFENELQPVFRPSNSRSKFAQGE